MSLTSKQIRETFLRFFEKRGHRVVRSSSLVPVGDSSLLFTNAGMNQFKNVFTGREVRDYKRAVSSQKCLRVSGKHNDLEQVGRTSRHHTFFEMLGNFSFGDYFKEEAIASAWELLTVEFALPIENLWLTVFGGSDRFEADEEAAGIWLRQPRVKPERILRYGEADNFWRMGDTGPCGPCSEIHYDHGPGIGCGRAECDPACECDRFVELWNLVFMQFEQKPDGEVASLPAPSIDTGMGLERISAVGQGVPSNYDTDLFLPLLHAVAGATGSTYPEDPSRDVSMRVIADHMRAAAFLIADGVVPSNDKRGYVLRRVLRRAIRHGQLLGMTRPFLHHLLRTVADTMGSTYPEILESATIADTLVQREEEQFLRTLAIGATTLEVEIKKITGSGGASVLPGQIAFRLYDTFGLPLDLARDIAAEHGFTIDEAGFEKEMESQRDRARRSWQGGGEADGAGKAPPAIAHLDLIIKPGELPPSEFCGYRTTRLEDCEVEWIVSGTGSRGEAARLERLRQGEQGRVLLDRTPFYAEGGGQVGDIGFLAGPDGVAEVTDTQPLVPGANLHLVRVIEGSLATGQKVTAEVDGRRRRSIMRNHTATHLLHAALRETVGTHIKQAGSLVAPDRLRFDFRHFQGLDGGAIREIEDLINEKVLEDLALETEVMPIDEAIRAGAMALFGEKYGAKVRVVRIGEFSVELCGGTHTARTGEIGPFRLLAEKGIASGVRRIEALTGEAALRRMQEESDLLKSVEQTIGVQRSDLMAGIEKKLAHGKDLQREIERLRMKIAESAPAGNAGEEFVAAGESRIVGRRVDGLSQVEMRSLADSLKQRIHSGVVILGRAEEEKVSLLVSVTSDLSSRVHAGKLVKRLAEMVGGAGGGRPDMAEAGGKSPERLDEAIRTGVAEARATLLQA